MGGQKDRRVAVPEYPTVLAVGHQILLKGGGRREASHVRTEPRQGFHELLAEGLGRELREAGVMVAEGLDEDRKGGGGEVLPGENRPGRELRGKMFLHFIGRGCGVAQEFNQFVSGVLGRSSGDCRGVGKRW